MIKKYTPKDKSECTREYYNQNAREYFERTKDIVQLNVLNAFLNLIDRNETILDLGSGSGNNLKVIIAKGYTAIGCDNATELIHYAKAFTNAEIYNINMADVKKINDFIKENKVKHLFANASLIHLTRKAFMNFMNKIEISGYFYFSLKEGDRASFDKFGRFFTLYSKEDVDNILHSRFKEIFFSVTKDRIERGFDWLNWIVRLKNQYRSET